LVGHFGRKSCLRPGILGVGWKLASGPGGRNFVELKPFTDEAEPEQ
jgi:hypothetical protein